MNFQGGNSERRTDDLINRPRLLERFRDLDHGGRIVSVWAPAGTGKTVLLRQWADTVDGRPEIVDCADEPRVVSALDEARAGRRRHLVLDRVELATPANRRAILALLENVGADTKIVLAGRFDPFPSSAWRWVVTREIRQADLVFTAPEVLELIGPNRVGEHEVERILSLTDGWPVALTLLARLVGEADVADVLARFDGSSRPIAEYLMGELLDGLPADERDVLVWSAVARTVPASLVEDLAQRPGSSLILSELARSHTLLHEGVDCYEFHPLLATFLRAEQHRADRARARRNHLRAADWFARRGDLRAGLEQIEHADAPDALAAYLDAHGPSLIFGGDSGPVMHAVRSLPPVERERLEADMRLLLDVPHFSDRDGARRRLAVRTAARRGSSSPVDEIIDLLWAHATGDRRDSAAGAATAARAALDAGLRSFRAIADAWVSEDVPRADGRLPKTERLIGIAAHLSPTGAERWLRLLALESALSVVAEAGRWVDVETVLLSLGRELIEHPDAADSVAARATFAVAAQAYHRGDALPLGTLRPLADAVESPVESDMKHLARALAALDALERRPGAEALNALTVIMEEDLTDSPTSLAYAVVPWMSAAVWHGDAALADRILFRVRRVLGADCLETLVTAFVGRPSRQTEAALRRGLEAGVAKVSPLTLSYAWVNLATYAEQRGQHAAATEWILNALMCAAPLGAIRPFLQEGNQPAILLRSRTDRLGAWGAFACSVIDRAAETSAVGVPNLPALTPRERELVRELPAHQSIADIARRRQVSVNTVKSQLRSVYGKLGAANRAEAVSMARELGLL